MTSSSSERRDVENGVNEIEVVVRRESATREIEASAGGENEMNEIEVVVRRESEMGEAEAVAGGENATSKIEIVVEQKSEKREAEAVAGGENATSEIEVVVEHKSEKREAEAVAGGENATSEIEVVVEQKSEKREVEAVAGGENAISEIEVVVEQKSEKREAEAAAGGENETSVVGGEGETSNIEDVVDDEIDEEDSTESLSRFIELYRAATQGDWNSIKAFLKNNPDGSVAEINDQSDTLLHIAVFTLSAPHLKELMDEMSPQDLEIENIICKTALHNAATGGNLEAARLLVEKNPQLPNIADKHGEVPLNYAVRYKSKELVLYLLEVTNRDAYLITPNEGRAGAEFVCSLIESQFIDVALDVLKGEPDLATVDFTNCPLLQLSAGLFPSATRYNIWERLIYKYCVPRFKEIKDAKELHQHSLRLVEFLCKEISHMNDENSLQILVEATIRAAKLGIHEIIEEILLAVPNTAFSMHHGQGIFQIAVEYRWHNVFNLLYQMSEQRKYICVIRSTDGNNILHRAAKLPSPNRLNLVPGAALQMQRELQWYKAVEALSLPFQREEMNAEEKVPAVLFAEEHKELVKKGEEWMRHTATSCTISAALITTITFAAAISVSHDKKSNNEALFWAFTISIALSQFFSVISLSIFLSMLTARYAQEDFLYSLPTRLILGLIALSVSITCMVATFSLVLFLMSDKINVGILAFLAACAGVPIVFFLFLQFPLLVDMFSYTYGRGIFKKQGDRLLF